MSLRRRKNKVPGPCAKSGCGRRQDGHLTALRDQVEERLMIKRREFLGVHRCGPTRSGNSKRRKPKDAQASMLLTSDLDHRLTHLASFPIMTGSSFSMY